VGILGLPQGRSWGTERTDSLPPWRSPEVADLLPLVPKGGIKLPLSLDCRQAGRGRAVSQVSGFPVSGRLYTPWSGWVTQYPVRPSGWQKCQDWRVVGNLICTSPQGVCKSARFCKQKRGGTFPGCPGWQIHSRRDPQREESLLCYPPGSEGRCTRYTTPGGGQNKNSVEGFSTEFPGAVSACVVLCGRGIVFAGEGYNLQDKDTDFPPDSNSKYLLYPGGGVSN